MGKLDGRVAVVTGGGTGLGREIVEAYAAAGAAVVVASRKLDSCERAASEVRDRYGVEALGLSCNVGVWSECDALVETVRDKFGQVDILVNNAGAAPIYRDMSDLTERMWRKVLEVNLLGAVALSQGFGTQMAEAGRGSIINITSTGAVRPKDPFVPYAVAKAGLNTLTEAFAQSLGPRGVRVNAIQCGPFATEMANAWDDKVVKVLEKTAALRRIGQPREIQAAALYLASDESAFMTGAILRLDGGATF
jgi:NAD(P)-dependent dehydrogenase (short-subunit alcohol dehydrogenase family)